MLEQPIAALFLRMIPESILVFYASYIIINKKLDNKKILFSGILSGIIMYLVRMLPINFGVHTILGLLAYIGLLSKVHGIELFKSIKLSLTAMVIMFISDSATLYICVNMLNIPQQILFSKSIQSTLLSMLTLIIFSLILVLIKLVKKKRRIEYEV